MGSSVDGGREKDEEETQDFDLVPVKFCCRADVVRAPDSFFPDHVLGRHPEILISPDPQDRNYVGPTLILSPCPSAPFMFSGMVNPAQNNKSTVTPNNLSVKLGSLSTSSSSSTSAFALF